MTIVARGQPFKIKWNADLLNRKKVLTKEKGEHSYRRREELMVYKQN